MALLPSSSWFDVNVGVRARPAQREFVEAVGSFGYSAENIVTLQGRSVMLLFVSRTSGGLPATKASVYDGRAMRKAKVMVV